jgi:Ferritin-like domain
MNDSRLTRRQMLRNTGLMTAGALLASQLPNMTQAQMADIDVDVLNFALNLEYLEAEFYLAAVGRTPKYGADGVGGAGGTVTGGKAVTFSNTPFGKAAKEYANEIADDEEQHVLFLRKALGAKAVARPNINIGTAFADAADKASAGAIKGFDPYANELFFLHGAYIFEDVGVTAYKGAARLITNKDYLEAAAGILGVEAYHAGEVRTLLYSQKDVVAAAGLTVTQIVQAISKLRDTLAGTAKDQGIVTADGKANIVLADSNSIAFSRSTDEVLKIVYGSASKTPGLFFPDGLNGSIK